MPNHRITSGISASGGTLRTICSEVSSKVSAVLNVPVSRPSTRPRPPPMARPASARPVLIATSCASSPDFSRFQNAVATANGSGRMRDDSQPEREAISQPTITAIGTSQGARPRR